MWIGAPLIIGSVVIDVGTFLTLVYPSFTNRLCLFRVLLLVPLDGQFNRWETETRKHLFNLTLLRLNLCYAYRDEQRSE
ncbi:hypothetical protein BJY04DRAFT_188390 [Aspergillus karnatakaensis]|uniref:uncharacterized protein n=1 Tax=Aspergillus karnatakaensis TaxID=1810916 RepID=UPI003CCD21BD